LIESTPWPSLLEFSSRHYLFHAGGVHITALVDPLPELHGQLAQLGFAAEVQIAGCRAGYRSGASVHTQQHKIDGARRRRSAVEWHRTSLRLTGNNSQTNHAHARQAAATAT
jgi:hypothetical protein